MSNGGAIKTTTDCQNQLADRADSIRSKYADIRVKVDEYVYHLDRLQLAYKSDYFEKLFTEDFHEKNCDLIELPVMDSDIFSAVVDIIYGQNLNHVLNTNNYVNLLMAMDYLQINIDLNVFESFVKNFVIKQPSFDAKIFRLCEYMAENRNFDDLMPVVFSCLSVHFVEAADHQEFQSLSLDNLVKIISSEGYEFRNVYDIRDHCEICVKWIFHDTKNRLPQAVKLVNAVKYKLRFQHQIDDLDFSIMMRNGGEEITKAAVLRHFHKMVVYMGEIGENNLVTQEWQMNEERDESGKCTDFDRYYKEESQNELDKMTRFLENKNFSDIVVKVDGKSFKLHRCKLDLESGYFADVFSSQFSEKSCQPNQEEYLLDVEGIDGTIFEMLIGYMYCRKIEPTSIVLKIWRLLDECELWIKKNVDTISFKNVVEIQLLIHQKKESVSGFENTYLKLLLCKRILALWSETDDVSSFCAISIDTLEDLLVSSALHMEIDPCSLPSVFCNDDEYKLLDICSKWVIEDVQNRYQFIPRIVLAINCNRMLNCSDLKMQEPSDLSNCSQQFVRDQFSEMLSSISLIPRDMLLLDNIPREIKEEPIFVASKGPDRIRLLNSDLDEISSLGFSIGPSKRFMIYANPLFVSAAEIGDNLFIAASVLENYNRIFFQAYNISSKKFTSLACIPQPVKYSRHVLVNCRNQIYCCFENSYVLKYSMQSNRWMGFSELDTSKTKVLFTSDGDILYRMYPISQNEVYQFEMYNFDENTWVSLIFTLQLEFSAPPIAFSIINSRNFAVLFASYLYVRDENTQNWHEIPLFMLDKRGDEYLSTVAQCENGILFVNGNKSYRLNPTDGSWHLKNEIQSHSMYEKYDSLFGCFSSIHRPFATVNENDILF